MGRIREIKKQDVDTLFTQSAFTSEEKAVEAIRKAAASENGILSLR